MQNENDEKFEKGRGFARGFSAAVYIGGVIAATMLFISFILLAFPADAYFSRVVMTIAGLMVGGSMLAFPYALHQWAITKDHRKWTTILYYVEMVIIAVNTVVSFVSLLSKYTGYAAPEWVVLYEPFSVGSIIYTIFAWGTVFLTDPEHKLHAQERDADARFMAKISAKRDEFIESKQGEDLVMQITTVDVMDRFAPERFNKGKRDFGSGKSIEVSAEKPFEAKQSKLPPLPIIDDDKQ